MEANRIRLNIGGGDTEVPGFVNFDIKDGNDARKLPYEDGTVDEIRASHVLEHFSHRETADVLAEWVRVLKPGGWLRVAVPNGLTAMRAIIDTVDGRADHDVAFMSCVLLGGHRDAHDVHGAMFDEAGLNWMMSRAGLINMRPWKSEVADCAAMDVSLNLAGMKPIPWERGQHKVHMLMSLPRLCWTRNHACCLSVCYQLGIEVHTTEGAYFHQCMQNAMEELFGLKPGSEDRELDYLITVDYDTVFTPADVVSLLTLMEANPDVSAVAALQQKRMCDDLLFSVGKKEIAVSAFDCDLLDVKSMHFGLTVFRVSDLKTLPRPWFEGNASPDGSFQTEGAVDPDIAFWRTMRENGRRFCLAPRVCVGHMQEVITWPGMDLRPIHQHMPDYRENGKPKGVHQ